MVMKKYLVVLLALFVFCVSNSSAFARHHYNHYAIHKHIVQKQIIKKIPIVTPTKTTYIEINRGGRSNKVDVFTADPTVQLPDSITKFVMNTHKNVLVVTGDEPIARKEDIEGLGLINISTKYMGLEAHTNKKDLMALFNTTIHQVVDPTVTPWCAAFVNAMLAKLGMKGTNSLAAGSFITWGRKTTDPRKNDIVLLKFNNKAALNGISHVTFYIDTVVIKGVKYVKVLGGNQDHSVKVSYYPIHTVVQFRTLG